ncbi:hypothetical protein AB0O77_23910 [Streptomyces albidoflavus]|uniref:hypothetical protein n=1 Tax=Streptomyces albidoflavus TaxID=1886 RepID=UPI00343E2605
MTTNPSSPREALAHTLATFADEPDSAMAVVATRNQPVRGAVTGLTWGDLRALAAEAGTTAASAPLSPEYLAWIAARAEAATAGPWCTDGAEIYQGDEYVSYAFWVGETCRADEADGGLLDAAFIAHARTDIPALLAEVERLRAELAARPTRAEATASPVRTERSRWQAVADALNEIDIAGIDLDGTIAGHNAWSVVRDRDAGWMVSGYDAEAGESR